MARRPEGGPERMCQIGEDLGKIRKIIDEGKPGSEVFFPLNEASLILRIPKKTLENLAEGGQTLGVSATKETVAIKLRGNLSQQREAYSFLYGLVQSLKDSRADLFLKNQEAPLLLTEGNPDFEETIAVIKKGKYDLSDEELAALHLQLWGHWQSLVDKADLFPPEKVFS